MIGVEYITYDRNGKKYLVKRIDKPLTVDAGKIDVADLLDIKNGDVLKTSKENELVFIKPSFRDKYNSMKRGAQSIKLKDCAAILAETLVGKESVCLDCGAGMGGLTCFLARYVKKVYSLDVKEVHLENSKNNAEMLGLKNINFMLHDIYEGIPKKNLDLITLDLIHPENVVDYALKSLKPGGYIVAYCPQATQMQAFALKVQEVGMELMKCMEVNRRDWKVENKVIRPEHMGLQHTAFLVFARRTF